MNKRILFFATVALTLFSATTFAQDTAYVPFKVNVNAKVKAQQDEKIFSKDVTANTLDTLLIVQKGQVPVLSSGRTQKPVTMHSSRGKLSLELSSQVYKSVEISLYSLNGKRVLHDRVSASAARNISHPNIATGVYVLYVKGGSNTFSTRLAHQGGGMNIDVSFGGISPLKKEQSEAFGAWEITVSAEGYESFEYTLNPVIGINKLQDITLNPLSSSSDHQSSSSEEDTPSSSSEDDTSSSSSEDDTPSSSSEDDTSSSSSEDDTPSSSSEEDTSSSSSDEDISSSSSEDAEPVFACDMTATTGTKNMPISPAPTATCDGDPVSNSILTWNPSGYIPTAAGPFVVKVTANLGLCQGMTAECASITVHEPTLTCTMEATTGKVGEQITPAPEVSCSGSLVTTDLTWTPQHLTLIEAGIFTVSVEAGSGVCIGKTAECGSIDVEEEEEELFELKSGISPNGWYEYRPNVLYLKEKPKDSDGKEYEAVLIGTQVWMAENLNLGLKDGGGVCRSLVKDPTYELEPITDCENNPYGRVYTWDEAMNEEQNSNANPSGVQGICPDGWHLPSETEFQTLLNFVGETPNARAKILRSTKSYENDGYGWFGGREGTDEFGFSALSSGDINLMDTRFRQNITTGTWWSTTTNSTCTGAKDGHCPYHLNTSGTVAAMVANIQSAAKATPTNLNPPKRSIRCVKDTTH